MNIAATVHYSDGSRDITYFGERLADATMFAADNAYRPDITKVTVEYEHGTLTLIHTTN